MRDRLQIQIERVVVEQLHGAVDHARVRRLLADRVLLEAQIPGGRVRRRVTDLAEHTRRAQARVEVEVLVREAARHHG